MKPISLKFQAFGSYIDEQFIDFSRLYKAGLFLIHGETGSGKTIILDAITYALFGKSSGALRGDLISMRSQLAQPDIITYVEFIFEINEKKYKFYRSIKCIKKRNSQIECSITQDAFFQNDLGIFETFFENPKITSVNSKAVELIQLNYDQFRQVIILPQGQFEKFLVAKSDEKEEILETIFNTIKWKKIADLLNYNFREEKKLLDEQKASHDRIFSEYSINNFNELICLLDEKKSQHKHKMNILQDITTNLSKLKFEFDIEKGIFDKFSQLTILKKETEDMKTLEHEILIMNETLLKADNAEQLKPIFGNLSNSRKNLELRNLSYSNQKQIVAICLKELNSSKENFKKMEDSELTIASEKERLVNLNQMTKTYEQLESGGKLANEAANHYNHLQNIVNKMSEDLSSIENERQTLESQQATQYEEYSIMYKKYIENISGVLAKKLQNNEPCPVCGSLTHPTPTSSTMENVTSEIIDSKKAEIDKTHIKISQNLEHLRKVSDEFSLKSQELSIALQKKENLTTTFNNLCATIDPEISNLDTLKKVISVLTEKISTHTNAKILCKNILDNNDKSMATAKTTLSLYKSEVENAKNTTEILNKNFESLLLENGFTSYEEFTNNLLEKTEKLQISQKIDNYNMQKHSNELSVSKLQTELSGKTIPNIRMLQDKLEKIEQEKLKISSEIAVLDDNINRLSKIVSKLKKEIPIYESAVKLNGENQIFADQIRGNKGIGFARYVLGVMLSEITIEANLLLKNVHGGRYSLHRTLEATDGRHKAGLELEVHDNQSNDNRSVTSLSGGEKFLVSLTLAIGLSTVVQTQAGGIKIDTMFIDEGFGTLDSSSISDALLILSDRRKANGLIGIISHVSALNECIETKIEVLKGKNGSHLSIIAI